LTKRPPFLLELGGKRVDIDSALAKLARNHLAVAPVGR